MYAGTGRAHGVLRGGALVVTEVAPGEVRPPSRLAQRRALCVVVSDIGSVVVAELRLRRDAEQVRRWVRPHGRRVSDGAPIEPDGVSRSNLDDLDLVPVCV